MVSSLPELRTAAERLESLITDTRQYTGAVSLDISHGSMASRTAEGFYKTTINGADYLCDYFNHIGEDDLLNNNNNNNNFISIAVYTKALYRFTI